MITGLVLFIGGVVLGILAWIVGALNMLSIANGSLTSKRRIIRDPENSFRNHIGCMIVMALGSLCSFIGFVIIVINGVLFLVEKAG